ncbi:discoidin domain-containing protein [Nostoc sp. HG1]|nr:discoidin domain-containing protein [Nostoc sp. HG1]
MPQIKDVPTRTVAGAEDLLIMQDKETGETFNISKANLLAGLSSSEGGGGGTTVTQYNFASVGDTNGVIYAIGTNKNTTAFSNPSLDNRIGVTSSSILNNNPFTKAFGRIPTVAHSLNGGIQWLKIDFGSNNKIKINKYIIQGRDDFNGHHPRNWELQGSNDDASWAVIDSQVNNSSINQGTWFQSAVITSAILYRYLRVIQTGLNSSGDTYLALGQMEFYGELQ